MVIDRPDLIVVHGPRGGGKSYGAGFATLVDSLIWRRHGTRILGGSLAQSQQIYSALRDFDERRPGSWSVITQRHARTVEGSTVAILSASRTSVRGPHVPTLRLDEVDEIEDDLRESAMGMALGQGGARASVSLTSTWHRVGGAMSRLRETMGDSIPWFTFCAFEVLERCPVERSGPRLEHCPDCPLVKWCHDDGGPKAKRSAGHYPIDTLIQKVRAVSARVFESDYLCRKPKADGVWFKAFDPAIHVDPLAAYDPSLPVHLAIDSGVFTGAVAFQIRHRPGQAPGVVVFADWLLEDVPARRAAQTIRGELGARVGSLLHVWTDPAGGARTPIGPTVLGEYSEAGLKATPWPGGSVADGLALVESLVDPAWGRARLAITPDCSHLPAALEAYRRARRGGQWQDYPEDPQHPFEDLVDALRGGLRAALPDGLVAPRPMATKRVVDVLY